MQNADLSANCATRDSKLSVSWIIDFIFAFQIRNPSDLILVTSDSQMIFEISRVGPMDILDPALVGTGGSCLEPREATKPIVPLGTDHRGNC